jgi:hypothetical protein
MGASLLMFGAAAVISLAVFWYMAGAGKDSPLDSASNRPAVAPDGDVIARVGGESIHESDLASLTARYPHAQAKDILAAEIRRRSTLLAARRAGYQDHPEIQRQLEEMLVSRYVADELTARLSDVSVDADEVDGRLRDPSQDAPVAQRRAAILRLQAMTEEQREAARAQLQAALAALPSVESRLAHFGLLAERYSDHPGSKRRGGVIGAFGPQHNEHDRIPLSVHQALWRLGAPGDVSPVVTTENALWLIRFVDESPIQSAGASNSRLVVEHRLLQSKRAELRRAFFAELERRAGVQIRNDWEGVLATPDDTTPPSVPPMPAGLSTEATSKQ